MSSVIDLASRRVRPVPSAEIVHPAGVRIPFDKSVFCEFLVPEVRGDISSGSYSADLIRHVSSSVFPGDRVLVIGAGLGILSTLIAKTGHAERVLAVEADPRLMPCLKRVHAMNGVNWVEALHGVPSAEASGLIPFFVAPDIRDSALLPMDGAGDPFLVPCLDLNLILSDERISLIVCDIPGAPTRLLTQVDLNGVDRLLIRRGVGQSAKSDEAEFLAQMQTRGYVARSWENVLLFERSDDARSGTIKSDHWGNFACGF